MNDELRDRMLEICLEEALGRRTPPDVAARVLARLHETPLLAPPVVEPPVMDRRGEVQTPIDSLPATHAPWNANPDGGVTVSSRNGRHAKPTRRSRTNRWSGVALVAAMLMLGGGFGIMFVRLQDNQAAKGNGNKPGDQVANESPRGHAPNAPTSASVARSNTDRDDAHPDRAVLVPSPMRDPGRSAIESVADGAARPSAGASDDGSAFNGAVGPFSIDHRPATSASANDSRRPRPKRMDESAIVAAINQQVRQGWTQFDVKASAPATDAEWCRRAYLRLVGRIPSVNEVAAFVDSGSDAKRRELVDQLVGSREFAENWSSILTNVLIGRTGGVGDGETATRAGLRRYLEDSLADGTPWDELTYRLVSAEGSNAADAEDYNGAVNFLATLDAPHATLATARTMQAFLGQQIRCVQCHDHPTEGGATQRDFWAINSFFRQMRIERAGPNGTLRLTDVDFLGEGTGDLQEAEVYYEELNGYKRAAYPAFPGTPDISRSGDLDVLHRRRTLARLVAQSGDLPLAMANRMWSQFFGYGFTRPVDDLGPHNAPSHPQLLNTLAGQFAAHDYDLRSLARWIALSEPFGLSSKTGGGQLADAPESGAVPLFSRYYTRQLEPEEVYRSLLVAARAPSQSGSSVQARQDWLAQFARNMETDEGDEIIAFQGDIQQSLVMMNGPLMQQATSLREGSWLRRLIDSPMTPAEKVEHLFLASVARKPTPREEKLAVEMIQSRENAASALQDIWWALLNSSEFILDH